jgi:acyl dehydratase
VVARAIVEGLCGGDEARLRSFGMRFSSPVFPGETLRTDFWTERDGCCAFRSVVIERDVLVGTGGKATFDV